MFPKLRNNKKGLKKKKREKKKEKLNVFPPHSNTNAHHILTALSPTLLETHARTHTFIHTHKCIQSQSQMERERKGDGIEGSVWTGAVTASPHPTHLRLP